MVLLSMLLARTIAGPVRRLADAAENVQRRIRSRGEIPDFTHRRDEIGELSGALREMTNSLYSRIEAIESFAADVAHELKNPLTSLRSAVETMPLAKTPESHARLLAVIEHDVRRLDRLISDVSDASRLDAELQRHDVAPVDLTRLLNTVVTVANEVRRDDGVTVTLAFESGAKPFIVPGHDSRLGQVIDNLIENARSFSPQGGTVRITARRLRNAVEITVDDDGPGIQPDAMERIFERFYTDRPHQGFGQNSGLGFVHLAPDRRSAWRPHPRRKPHGRVDRPGRTESARRALRGAPAGDVTGAPPSEARVRRDMNQLSTIHASAVLVGARAVLIRGAAGAGKSRLAFALIEAGRCGALPFARLVGDDRVHIGSSPRPPAGAARRGARGPNRNTRPRHQASSVRTGRGRRPGGRPWGGRHGAASEARIRRYGSRRDRSPATCGRGRDGPFADGYCCTAYQGFRPLKPVFGLDAALRNILPTPRHPLALARRMVMMAPFRAVGRKPRRPEFPIFK